MSVSSHDSAVSIATSPHIPDPKGTPIADWSLGAIGHLDFHITNTVFTTWVFMAVLFALVVLFYIAITTSRLQGIKSVGLDISQRLYATIAGLAQNKEFSDRYFWLLGGLMIVIFVGNIFGLMVDWFILISHHSALATYLRPIYSDFNTTLFLAGFVIILAQILGLKNKGLTHQIKHYLFHYHGGSTIEKVVNVFVGWLHFMGEFIRVGSLSMRLFLNIFVGAILISVAVYIGGLIPSLGTGVFQLLSLPFWFFELLVAFLQAYIFMVLSTLYLKESLPESHH